MLKDFFQVFSDLVYPRNCLICKRYLTTDNKSEILCLDCQEKLAVNSPPFCLRCSRHLECVTDQALCRTCRRNEYHFDRAWATTFYNETMQALIHLFKYQSKTLLKDYFTGLMSSFIKNYGIAMEEFDIITSIPLHSARLRERGYNQSQLLCENISKEFKMKQSNKNLIRKRPTENQALLGKKERWTNIQGAFKIMDSSEFSEKSVLIIDDLFTTGATVSEAAHILKDAGATKVSALTLAIAN